jgi:hypothetical protein
MAFANLVTLGYGDLFRDGTAQLLYGTVDAGSFDNLRDGKRAQLFSVGTNYTGSYYRVGIECIVADADVIRTGTAQGGAAGYITLDAAAAIDDDVYNNLIIRLTGGAGVGQVRLADDYDGSNQRLTPDSSFSPAPNATTTFEITTGALAPNMLAFFGQDIAAGDTVHVSYKRHSSESYTEAFNVNAGTYAAGADFLVTFGSTLYARYWLVEIRSVDDPGIYNLGEFLLGYYHEFGAGVGRPWGRDKTKDFSFVATPRHIRYATAGLRDEESVYRFPAEQLQDDDWTALETAYKTAGPVWPLGLCIGETGSVRLATFTAFEEPVLQADLGASTSTHKTQIHLKELTA